MSIAIPEHIKTAIRHLSGLRINERDYPRLEKFLATRIRELELTDPEDYLHHLKSGSHREGELRLLAELFTSRETFFMRDAGQMHLLKHTLLPEIIERRASQRRLRIWSAACASGEEAYSLAILIYESIADIDAWDILIIGTDINPEAIIQADNAVYSDWAFRGCDTAFRHQYFHRHNRGWQLNDRIRRMVRFAQKDLTHDVLPNPADALYEMDLILCRNFFIYLDPAAIAGVTRKLAECLCKEGMLMTGHGELQAHQPQGLQLFSYPESVVYRQTDQQAQTLSPLPPIGKQVIHSTLHTAPTPPLPPHSNRFVSPTPTKTDGLQQAWRQADRGNLQEAESICQAIIDEDPMLAEAHYLAAMIALELKAPDRARTSLRKAIYLNPQLIAAYVRLAELQAQAGEIRAGENAVLIACKLLRSLAPDATIPYFGDSKAAEIADYLESNRHFQHNTHNMR